MTSEVVAADLGTGPRAVVGGPLPAFSLPPDLARQSYWSGFYAGLSAAYGWGHSAQNYERAGDHGAASTDPAGFAGSVTLGYNFDMGGGFVAGIEGDLGLMDISEGAKEVYDGHIYKTSYGPGWGTLRGRAGYAFGPTLVYATGGFAFMALDDVSIGNTPGETAINEDFKTGWVLGAGVEQVLSPGMTVKLEYLHMDFGTYDGLSANRERFSFENDVDLVRAGINYRF